MCDDKKYSSRSVIQFPQFSVWWMQMDKVRPVVVVSNNWFNTYSNGILVASMTSTDYDDKLEKEYGKMLIPIVGHNRQRSFIKLNQLRFVSTQELVTLSIDCYAGFITDIIIQKKITELMSGIFVPEFNSYFTTSEFIMSQNESVEPVVKTDRSSPNDYWNNQRRALAISNSNKSNSNSPIKNRSRNFIVNGNRIKKDVPTDDSAKNATVPTDDKYVVRQLIANHSYDEQLALEYYRTRGILDDQDLIVNYIAYVVDNSYTEIASKLNVTQSSVNSKSQKVIAFADMKQYITPEEISFIRNRIRERKRTKN